MGKKQQIQKQQTIKPEILSTEMKKRKIRRRRWIFVILVFTILQFGGLFALDLFLKQPDLAAVAQPAEKPAITPPAEAVMYTISEDQSDIAYTTKDGELVIADAEKQELFRQKVGNVTYLHWLSKSNALLYMVGKANSQEFYLLQTNGLQAAGSSANPGDTGTGTGTASKHNTPKLLKTWSGTKRTIENIYFSPYVEFFNVHVKNGTKDEFYKYKANTNLFQISFSLKVESIEYDDRKDILTVTIPSGQQYRLAENDRFVPLSGPNLNKDTQTQNQNQNQTQNQNPAQTQQSQQTQNTHEVTSQPIEPQPFPFWNEK